jgi:hypothetical protein
LLGLDRLPAFDIHEHPLQTLLGGGIKAQAASVSRAT